MSLAKSSLAWFRQNFSWSNSRESWVERLLGLGFLLAAVVLAYLSFARLSLGQSTVAWSVLAIIIAVCSRQGWIRLLGPVLFYDMICTARRSRYVIMRLLYAMLLLFILSFLFVQVRFGHRHDVNAESVFFGVIAFFVLLLAQFGLVGLLYFVTSRVGRLIIGGFLAGGAFLFILGAIALSFLEDGGNRMDHQRRVLEAAQMAEVFFSVFMLVQLTMVVLLTPAYVAGAIAEEKDRKTLEFLLATDLNNREIILSKLLSRIANLTLFLLTGLPILSILQFIGGVDTQLMIVCFVGTGLALLGISSLSMLMSVMFKRPRDAIGITYLILIAYMATGTIGFSVSMSGHWFMTTEIWFNNEYTLLGIPLWPGPAAPTLGDLTSIVNAGNPLTTIIEVAMAINGVARGGGRTSLAAELPGIIEHFAWFHAPISILCIGWSIARLRAVALKQTVGGKTAKASWWQRYRPAVGELPMLWKEMNVEGGLRMGWILFIVASLLVLLTFGSGLLVIGAFTWENMLGNRLHWRELMEAMNIWFRIAGTGVAALMILHMAVRASTSISTERERDTFDALVTTPMSSEEMLIAKLLGSMTSLRLGWIWCAAMLALAVCTGGVHLMAVPLLVIAFAIYALLFSMIGTWFSMVAKTSLRATVYTVMTTIVLGFGHWLVTGMCCFMPLAIARLDRQGDMAEYLAKFQLGLTPPFVFGFLAYSWEDIGRGFNRREFGEFMIFSLIGLFLSAMACIILWFGVLVPKFRQITRREELIYQ